MEPMPDEVEEKVTRSYARSTPLPTRVRSGQMEKDCLLLEAVEVPWQDIELITLGVIDQIVRDADAPKTTMQKMMGKVMGKEDDKKSSRGQKEVREVYLLDLYVKGHPGAFRIDSGNLNYRSFLDEVGYVSLHNFYRFCVRLVRGASGTRVDDSMVAFLNRRREAVRHYNAVYDYELEAQQMLDRIDSLTPQAELDLSRESWVDEWDEW